MHKTYEFDGVRYNLFKAKGEVGDHILINRIFLPETNTFEEGDWFRTIVSQEDSFMGEIAFRLNEPIIVSGVQKDELDHGLDKYNVLKAIG